VKGNEALTETGICSIFQTYLDNKELIAFLSNPQMVRIGVEEDRLLVEGSARSEITTSPSSGVWSPDSGFSLFGAVDPADLSVCRLLPLARSWSALP
jgi:hypothetical protein